MKKYFKQYRHIGGFIREAVELIWLELVPKLKWKPPLCVIIIASILASILSICTVCLIIVFTPFWAYIFLMCEEDDEAETKYTYYD